MSFNHRITGACSVPASEVVNGGTQDDIQAAIDRLTPGRAKQEKVVLLGDFTISNRISVPDYTYLEIQGTLTAANSMTGNGVIVNSDSAGGNTDITIKGGYIDGNKANQSTYKSGIFLDNCSNVLIDNVVSNSNIDHGMDLVDVTDFVIQNCRCDSNGDDGITIHDACARGTVFNNICSNGASVGSGGTAQSSGIEIEGGTGSAPTDLNIIGNVCYGHGNATRSGQGIHINTDTGDTGVKRINVIGNICYNNYGKNMTCEGNTDPVYMEDCNFIGNNCYSTTDNSGLFINYAKGVTVSGNTISDSGVSGIETNNCDGVTITGNTLTGNTTKGIEINQASSNVTVTANSIKNSGIWGIRIEGDSIDVSNNLFSDDQGTATQKGIQITSTVTNSQVLNNRFDGLLTAGSTRAIEHASGGQCKVAYNVSSDSIDYVTENYGLATGISTGGTVAHSVRGTPDYINCTVNASSATPTDVVFTVDGTNITATFGGGGTIDFYWEARLQELT